MTPEDRDNALLDEAAITAIEPVRESDSLDEENTLKKDFVRRVSEGLEAGETDLVYELVEPLHPADIADIVEDLPPAEREAVFETIDEEVAAETLEEIDHDIRVSIVESLDSNRAADIVEVMDPDAAADLLLERAAEVLDANAVDVAASGPARNLCFVRV